MDLDLLDLYERASEWTASKAEGATRRMDATTPCDGWDVRTLMNHMLDTQHYFVHRRAARMHRRRLRRRRPNW